MPTFGDPTPIGPGPRIPPVRSPGDRGRTTIIVTGRPIAPDPIGPTPGPFETQPPRATPTATINSLATPAPARLLTVQPADGPVPLIYNGPITVGGKVIFFKRAGGTYYMDLAICEGPIDSITDIKFGDQTAGAVHCSTEIHLGVAGDTTSTRISVTESTYTIPEFIAHVVLQFGVPTSVTGPWNPFDFKCTVTGKLITNVSSGATNELNGFPPSIAYDILTDPNQANASTAINLTDFHAAEDYCEEMIDTDFPRWLISLMIDQQDTAENWVNTVLSYAMGHTRYIAGNLGCYLERPLDVATDPDAAEIVIDDQAQLAPDTGGEITYVQAGAGEVPTVVTVTYTDASAGYVSASVQIPDPGSFDTSLPWIETQLSMPGYTDIARGRLRAQREYNLRNLCDKDITAPLKAQALMLIPGDRVRVKSRTLLASTETPPNGDSIEGAEDCLVTDVKWGDKPIIRMGLYREAVYGDTVDHSGAPEPPPPPPDPSDPPDCPTDLAALHASPSDYGWIEFTPSASPLISHYRVIDIYASPIDLEPVPFTWPIDGDGKMHVYRPALLHDVSGIFYESVRVIAVTFGGLECSPGPTDSWNSGDAPPTTFPASAYALLWRWIAPNPPDALSPGTGEDPPGTDGDWTARLTPALDYPTGGYGAIFGSDGNSVELGPGATVIFPPTFGQLARRVSNDYADSDLDTPFPAAGYYDVYRTYLQFDTSSIPDAATVATAVIRLKLNLSNIDAGLYATDSSLTAVVLAGTGDGTISEANWNAFTGGDVNSDTPLSIVTNIDPLGGGAFLDLTINTADIPSVISLTGLSKFVIMTSGDFNGSSTFAFPSTFAHGSTEFFTRDSGAGVFLFADITTYSLILTYA